MKPLLIYSHAKEPITRALLDSSFCEKWGGLSISVENFIAEMEVYDEFDESTVKINWWHSSSKTIINNTKDYYLINRILSIPESFFKIFSTQDQAFVAAEYRAYFLFAMQAFPFSFVKPGPFGMCGNRFSLPRQWSIIKRSLTDLMSVPNFYLGNMKFCELTKNVVYSDPNNFYFWKPSEVKKEDFSFAFEKPDGLPVIGCVIGNHKTIFSYYENDHICEEMKSKILHSLDELQNLFGFSGILECLIFLDRKQINFGMVNNLLLASKNKSWFTKHVKLFFEKEIREKQNV